jgi:hypothetical protein
MGAMFYPYIIINLFTKSGHNQGIIRPFPNPHGGLDRGKGWEYKGGYGKRH